MRKLSSVLLVGDDGWNCWKNNNNGDPSCLGMRLPLFVCAILGLTTPVLGMSDSERLILAFVLSTPLTSENKQGTCSFMAMTRIWFRYFVEFYFSRSHIQQMSSCLYHAGVRAPLRPLP